MTNPASPVVGILGALLLAAASPFACAQDAPRRNVSGGALEEGRASYDVRRYDLALDVDCEGRTIEGRLTLTAEATRETRAVVVDLDDALTVRSLACRDRATSWRHEDGRIHVAFEEALPAGRSFVLDIAYGGAPRTAVAPPWRGGFTWKRTADGAPWVATSCQGEGADLWWPCKDHPSDEPDGMSLAVTVPEGLFCAANGTLARREKKDGRETFHWNVANPIAPYAVAIAIAPYVQIETTFASSAGVEVPVYFWALPENEKKARALLPEVLEHLAFFEELCGPYPFRNEKYGVVETPFLGMEHQTCIAYGNRYQGLKVGWDWLHHHELAHEWWGNQLTCGDWKDMWIHEGFGTYMQALYLERKIGPEAYRGEMARYRAGIANRAPVAPRTTTDSSAIGAGSSDVYYKGAWILHTLRWLAGDEAFFRFLRTLCVPDEEAVKGAGPSPSRTVDTEEVIAVAERVLGRELDWFFDVYLRSAALPVLERRTLDDGRIAVTWRTPDDLPFPMPLPVRDAGGKAHRIEPVDGEAIVPAGSVIDPDHRVLRADQRARRLRER